MKIMHYQHNCDTPVLALICANFTESFQPGIDEMEDNNKKIQGHLLMVAKDYTQYQSKTY